MNKIMIPQNLQALMQQEREKMFSNVVKMIGKMSQVVVDEMTPQPEVIEVKSEIQSDVSAEAPSNEFTEKAIEKVLNKKFASVLHDVDHRINILYDVLSRFDGKASKGNPERANARDLNISKHMLEGYTFTDDSPSAGSVSWAGCHIVYKGTDYEIEDGNTSLKYIWWDFDGTPNTEFQTSNTKPTLTADDVLVAINEDGKARVMLSPGKLIPGIALTDGSIGSNELRNGAVIEGKIGPGAVTSGKLGDGAVLEGKIGNGAVTKDKIGAGAVAENKLNIASHLLY